VQALGGHGWVRARQLVGLYWVPRRTAANLQFGVLADVLWLSMGRARGITGSCTAAEHRNSDGLSIEHGMCVMCTWLACHYATMGSCMWRPSKALTNSVCVHSRCQAHAWVAGDCVSG
jgi:hypothetical protein